MLKPSTWCDSPVTRVIALFLQRCPKSFSDSFTSQWNGGNWDALVSMSPSTYLTSAPSEYQAVSDVMSLIKKLPEIPLSIDPDQAAMTLWHAMEQQCYVTNQRFRRIDSESEGIHEFIRQVQRKIRTVLGRPPRRLKPRFGPGTYLGGISHPTVADKMSGSLTFTLDSWVFLSDLSLTAWGRYIIDSKKELECVEGNRHAVVPKNAKISRSIGIEPLLNLYYQLAIGHDIRVKLKTGLAGIDLDLGQDLHRHHAREASVRGHLATIDLSSASDTIALEVVKLLVPHDWFAVLSSLRSPRTEIDGKQYLLEKFSSMGNGYTFELETLIFWAIAQTAQDTLSLDKGERVIVYGDDILIDDRAYEVVTKALTFFGFTVNSTKSFHGGPGFRESCGADFFRGWDVRGYSLKSLPVEPQHWIAFANGIQRLRQRNGGVDDDYYLHKAWRVVLDQLPVEIRSCRGPKDLGDICIHEPLTSRWTVRVKNSIRGIRSYVGSAEPDVAFDGYPYDVQLASVLYGMTVGESSKSRFRSVENPGRVLTSRRAIQSYRLTWTPFS